MNCTVKVGAQRYVETWHTNAPRPRVKERYLNSVGGTKMNDPLSSLATLAATMAFMAISGYVLCATQKYIESKLINKMDVELL